MADTITIQEVQAANNLGNIQDGDMLLAERVAGTGGVVTFNGVVYDADFAANGLMARTAAATYANRVLTGTANYIDIADGNGVAGNPTITVSPTYAGGTSIVSLGTVTTGTWNATPINMAYGGTGAALIASNGGIVYSTAGAMEILAGTLTAGKLLKSNALAAPAWTTATFSDVPGTAGKTLISDGTNWITSTSIFPNTVGAAGKILRSDGTVNAYSTSTFADTYAASTLLYSNGADTVTGLATANSGVLVTSAGGVPSIGTDIPTAVTIGGQYAYRAGGTDVPVTDGGTGVSTMTTAYAPVCAGTTATDSLQVASTGLSSIGYVLTSNGAAALPSFQAATAGAGSLKSFQIFTTGTAATYTRPAGVASILVELVGGGGGGGGIPTSGGATSAASGGGGAGGYARLWVAAASASYTYTVGAAGAGGVAGANNGSAGGTTTFNASSLQATGGSGGTAGAAAAVPVSNQGGAGGIGTNGNLNSGGAPGSLGSTSQTAMCGGHGGASFFGGGSVGTSTATGVAATGYGNGGGGTASFNSGSTYAGGAGSAGVIVVWEYS
jgi:hypothetical protein